MKYKTFLLLPLSVLLINCSSVQNDSTITFVPFNEVVLTDGFWKERMKTEVDVTVPFSVAQSEPAVERFRRCAAFLEGRDTPLPEPHRFISSDLYKVMEGVAYSLMIHHNKQLEEWMDTTIDLISRSQESDGYLYISHTCHNIFPEEMGTKPYSFVVHSHELYNVGHMYEAAVAYFQATGKRQLLNVAIKSAQHVNKVFFEGDPKYNDGKPINQAPGHQEIELALCKLYRITGDKLYLNMAKRFLDIRGITYIPDGEGIMSPFYAQQHAPVTEQTEPVGHAVRAAYMYTAMAQVDALTGRKDYEKALHSIWNNLVSTRMHITGGLGALEGVEGFGAPYELPNATAYNETCAAVANIFFNQGMFLATGDATFLDIAELSLYNNALAGISISGDRFFYVNPLEADGKHPFNHGNTGRAEWFSCACCPPNISRLILQVPGYMYAYSNDRIYLTHYGGSKVTISQRGVDVTMEQNTAYPFDGRVNVTLSLAKQTRFTLCLRIPTWATSNDFVPGGLYTYKTTTSKDLVLYVNGQSVEYVIDKGFAVINRSWAAGDRLEFVLPMPVRFVACNPNVKENLGTIAVTRGPLVYCAEEVDHGIPVQQLKVDGGREDAAQVEVIDKGVLKGINKITFQGAALQRDGRHTPFPFELIPYYAWNNRGDGGSMMVWLKE